MTNKNLANVAIIVLLVCLEMKLLEAAKSKKALCPIGFLVTNDSDGEPLCYRIKGPETFADKYENCAGNLYSLKLLQSLKITPSSQTIWTDYKNMYDGGLFVDWSYTKETGNKLKNPYDVNRDSMYSVNEELCVVIDPVINFTAVRCDEKHYRYCIVDVYEDLDEMSNDGCDSLQNPDSDDSLRFWSPIPTCLLKVVPQRGKVRMTWQQAQQACISRGGSLLNRGWKYSNYPFQNSKTGTLTYPLYPFGVIVSSNLTLLRYDADHDNALIPQSEWLFGGPMSNDTKLGAVRDDSWELVNSSYIFNDVICEKTIPLRHVNLSVSIDSDDGYQIILNVDTKDLKKDDIMCFTDSNSFYPQQIRIIKRNSKPGYIIIFNKDGYYWCTHKDLKTFHISESNKVLKINVKDNTENLYAVKLTSLAHDYDIKNMKAVLDDWKKKIEEYVSYSTKYRILHNISDYDNHTIWKFRNDNTGISVKNAQVTLKRLYLNSRSALLHVKLLHGMIPVPPGQWDDIEIIFMRPVYFCEKQDPLTKRLELGESKSTSACQIFNCVGDFNLGVQLIMTANKTCNMPKPLRNLSSSVSVDVNTTHTTPMSTKPTAPPPNKTAENTTQRQKLQMEVNSSDSSEEDGRPTNTTKPNCSGNNHANCSGPTKTTPSWNTESDTAATELENNTETYSEPSRPPPPPMSSTPTTVITAYPTFPPTPELTTSRPLPPEEQLLQVMGDLNTLLNNHTEPIMVADIEESLDQVDGFLSENEELEIPGDLLHILDKLGARIDLNGTVDAATVRDNVALLVADAQPSAPVRGLMIATRNDSTFTEEAFQFIRGDMDNDHLMADANEVVIHLPESVANSNRRISFVVFRNDRAFQSSHGLYSVNSRILSVNVENTTEFVDEVIEIFLTPMNKDPDRNESRSCAFWKFLDDGTGSGYWSQDGCTFIRATTDGMLDTCRCDHLTHFAEVLIPRTVFSERNENALELISIVGCFMSIFGLILVGVTALLFRSWRRDYSNKIWLQLCISIFIMSISFLVIVFANFEEYDVLCMVIGIVLHFSVLSSFCWMLIAAVLSYRRLVTVFSIEASHKLLRASAFAWGVPCAVVGILLSIAPHSYSGRFDDKNPTTAFCYPSGLARWLSVFAPIALMLIANWTLFALIVRSVFASRRNHPNRAMNRHNSDKREALRCASVSFFLVFLFGLPWIFGLMAMNVVMAYCFVILSTFQGFVLFLFFVLGNKNTRDLWLNKLKIKQTRKIPVTSSTYSNNRSTGAGNPNSTSGNQGQTIETKISRPKSLSSSDDSRFS